MWLAVLINDLFHDLYDLDNLLTAWQEHNVPLDLTFEHYYAIGAGTYGFALDSYREAVENPHHKGFSRRHPLWYFI